MRRRTVFFAFGAALLAAAAFARITSRDLTAIRAVLNAQAAAWNRGDIDGYMAGYAQSDETMFVGADVTRGWTKVRDRYKAKYDSRAKMGTLVFSDLDLRPLGSDDVIVTGAWKLTREADTPHGRFTLIFHRRSEGVADRVRPFVVKQ
jgi:ketosteroid isomerase-like protein